MALMVYTDEVILTETLLNIVQCHLNDWNVIIHAVQVVKDLTLQ